MELFRAAGAREDDASALVKLGDVHRYLNEWDSAILTYEEAAAEARAARTVPVECKALIGNARAHLIGKKSPRQALELVRQAILLAQRTNERLRRDHESVYTAPFDGLPNASRIGVEILDHGPDLLQAGRIDLERPEHQHPVVQLHFNIAGIGDLIDDPLWDRDLVLGSELGQRIAICLLCDYKKILPIVSPLPKTSSGEVSQCS